MKLGSRDNLVKFVLYPSKENVLHHAKHKFFSINPLLLKISNYKTLYNSSTSNPNGYFLGCKLIGLN